jgi:hypothetical protein
MESLSIDWSSTSQKTLISYRYRGFAAANCSRSYLEDQCLFAVNLLLNCGIVEANGDLWFL